MTHRCIYSLTQNSSTHPNVIYFFSLLVLESNSVRIFMTQCCLSASVYTFKVSGVLSAVSLVVPRFKLSTRPNQYRSVSSYYQITQLLLHTTNTYICGGPTDRYTDFIVELYNYFFFTTVICTV